MIMYCFYLSLSLILQLAPGHSGDTAQRKWQPLFNGADLADWIPKFSGHPLGENYKNTFVVRDGLLIVDYSRYDTFDNTFGHLFFRKPFRSYHLRAEYRFFGEQASGGAAWAWRNNGIMVHCQDPAKMGIDQAFPVSLEAQLLGGNGSDERPTGNLCTPGMHVKIEDQLVTDHCISSTSGTIHGDDWVTMEIIANPDGTFYHLVEGDTVMAYHSPVIGGDFLPEAYPIAEGTPVTGGYIAIQAESHPIAFRQIALKVLK